MEVAAFARERLPAAPLLLVGVSGGSIVALTMTASRPDLFAAFVGTGQFVHTARQDARSYEIVVARARAGGNQAALDQLTAIGPPPYADFSGEVVKAKFAGAPTSAEQKSFASLTPAEAEAMKNPPQEATYVPKGMAAIDQRALAAAAYRALRNEIAAFDAWTLGLSYSLPIFFFQGEDDAYTPSEEVAAFVEAISAPHKRLVRIAGGGHSAIFLRHEFLRLLNDYVGPMLTRRTPDLPAG
jgi:pimeloyl-ACP methyl ester carboxylesterase